jgi:hypothetical protein
MSSSYIPHTTAQPHNSAADHAAKQNSNARNAKDYLNADPEWKAEWSTDYGTDEGFGLGIDQSIDANFFDIAFSQITSAKQPSIDVYHVPPVTQDVRAMPAQVTDMEGFGRAFNFDPVLNLTTQQTGETILSELDQAGQAELVQQLIGGLPADVINTGFEQFTVAAGIESYDMAPSATGEISGDDVAINIFMHPIKPLQPLQGQLPTNSAVNGAVNGSGNATTGDNAQDAAYPALIATGLTPSQMTALSATQSEQSMQELSDVDVNLIAVIPVPINTQPVQTGAAQQNNDRMGGIPKTKPGHPEQHGTISASDLKALKDSIDQLVPLNQDNAANRTGQQNAQSAGNLDPQPSNNGASVSFESLVKTGFLAPDDLTVFTKENAATSANRDLPFIGGEARAAAGPTQSHAAHKAAGAAGQNAAEVAGAKAQTVSNASGIVPWDSLAEASSLDVPPEGLSLGQVLHNTAHTSPTLMHSHAAAPHQATQTIAAKLTQHATKSGEAELQIELDPPELGRVRIQMIAEGDGKVKAQLSFDKPETFLMMQRDAAQLEKALAEAGIDMGDNTLEFSLSSDNQGENHGDGDNNKGQHGASSGADGAGDDHAQDIEIITTKMDWYNDNNGNLRLDMLT